ncbi:hypothetical protein [Pedobacter chitinilyticus]|nr:hypothetical protein [Pedobacter chitinilyticus]
MKKLFLTLSLLLLINVAFSQTYRENINTSFKVYCDLMREGQLEKAFDYVHPDLFTIVPKADMLKMFNTLFNSGEFTFKFLDFSIKKFNEPLIVEGKHYVVFKYNSNIAMKFNQMDSTKYDLMKVGLANKFGSENVTLDKASGFFKINAEKKSIAISTNGATDWKFVNIEPEQRIIMEKLLPKAVRDEVF